MLTTHLNLGDKATNKLHTVASTFQPGHAEWNACRGKSTSNAVINIRNLRLRTYIGFNPEERIKQQDIVINIQIDYTPDKHALRDHVEAALDYKAITKNVIKHVEDGHFMLLEKLTSDVLTICSEHSDVNRARVTVDKPHALRFADSVSLTLEYQAAESTIVDAPESAR